MRSQSFPGPESSVGSFGQEFSSSGYPDYGEVGHMSSGWIKLNPSKHLAPLVRGKAEKGLSITSKVGGLEQGPSCLRVRVELLHGQILRLFLRNISSFSNFPLPLGPPGTRGDTLVGEL